MSTLSRYSPGQRVKVTQQMPRQQGAITTTVEGTILRFGQQKTGSWYAHGKDDKLWLDRLELRKADGEIVVLNLDRNSVVEDADSAAPQRPVARAAH
ncbi:MAG TPA: hypothetical protein VHC70_02770 [Phycisphaerales bacterium]|jgi:hypothetical protein|nr:hypothetical protein [Phycisphaerales bacterium]